MKELCRKVTFYNGHFQEFYNKQRAAVRKKITWTLEIIERVEIVPEIYLKHIENTRGLYEIRVQQASDIFRIFCFFDKGKVIVLGNGFQKKTQKTPLAEITKALKIKEEYEKNKK
ncbi:addiction module toxin RelE [Chitinophaga parva]|uniref:Addiction module toxin RelE n=1 Tax=Chitinophaga parva TaxID=2169414 RepID=A0A2T7BPN4_9BACT|nr:type II toxin-antitoxin system RelE/ParE family toxin [Chitinophaga parva]PUZ29638.1 addiction module toxin RelE [Chitinophaga parva]